MTLTRAPSGTDDQIVLENLRKVTSFARSEPEKFYELATKRGRVEASKIEKNAEKERATAEARIQKKTASSTVYMRIV